MTSTYYYPGHNCCTMWDGNYMQGTYFELCVNYDDQWHGFNLPDMGVHDINASFVCGKDLQYKFCDDGIDGPCYSAVTGAGHVRQSFAGLTDAVATVWMKTGYDPEEVGAVMTFDGANCQGWHNSFFADTNIGRKQGYTLQQMEQEHSGADFIYSVMVPWGYAIDVFDGAYFDGDYETVVGGPWRDANQQMACYNLRSLGDRVASLKVYKVAQAGVARGYWESITHSSAIDIEYQVGFSSGVDEMTSQSQKMGFDYSITEGIKFFGFTQSFSISESYSHSIQKDVEHSLGLNVNATMHTKCTKAQPGEGVGLWQWRVDTPDRLTSVLSRHTVCRYGANYTSSPECPWNACIDAQCTQCAGDWAA